LALQHYQAAIEELEAVRGSLNAEEHRAGFLQERWRCYPEIVELLGRLHERDPAGGYQRRALEYAERGKARSLLDELAGERGAVQAPRWPSPAPGEAWIEYALGEERSFAWLVRPPEVTMLKLPGRRALEQMVERFRAAAAHRPAGTAPAPFEPASRELYDTLLRGFAAGLKDVRRLTIIPDGTLCYLPFEALVTTPAGRPARYLIEEVSVGYAPSAGVLATLDEAAAPVSRNRLELLAYGDPVYARAAPSAQPVAAELVRRAYEAGGARFPALPNTRVELEQIGALFAPGARRLRLGAEASETAFKHEDLRRYRRIHFATHAVLDERFPKRSGIVLSLVDTGAEDGVLTVGEVLKLRLDADLVVLSACQTGLGRLQRGEGVVGLTRAFLHAGARRVVVSLWEASDTSTPDLMRGFYGAMRDGATPGQALREAKLKMLASGVPAYRHPYYWAGFVSVGLN
jgi:CHAT domain-containing protein